LNPKGRFSESRSYDYSKGSNRINDVAINSNDKAVLAGFDTGNDNSQWRVKKRRVNSWDYTANFSNDSDRATAVEVDSEDNVVVGGYDSSQGDGQWRVEKLDSEGEKIWTYTKNQSSGLDIVKDMAIDSKGNILVVGVDKKRGNDQWRLERLSSDGDFIGAYLLDPSNQSDVATAVEVDPEGNIILGGYDFREENARWRVIKLNSDMEVIWKYSSNPSNGSDQIQGITVDEYGNIIAGGYDSTQGDAQWRVEKLNSGGEKIWTYNNNPSSKFDVINDVEIDSKDNIALVGTTARNNYEFLVEKISERKYYNIEPEINILEEETFQEIPSLILGKLNSYDLRVEDGKVIGSINDNLISAPAQEGWMHLLLTYDGSQQRLYVDSNLEASQALSGNINTNYNNLLFGFNFAGSLDEAKIYNKALTSDEVQEIYQSF